MGPNVAVLGGGVNGISTALVILRLTPHCKMTVISEVYSPNTTGDGAAGLWSPYLLPGTSPEKVNQWSKDTWDLLSDWWRLGQPGICVVPVTKLSDEETPAPSWKHIPIAYKQMNQTEIRRYGSHYVHGEKYVAFTAEAPFFLQVLQEEISRLGGTFIQKRVNALTDIASDYDLIVNCTGIGAYDVTPDSKVYPIRGQVMRVNAPWIKEAIMDECEASHSYCIPNTNCIVLGGTHQEHDWRTEIDKQDSKDIWNKCTNFMPHLKNADIIQEWVGLRPAREGGVRLEADVIEYSLGSVPVVHNYGHGGSGLTLFWGCALEAASLASNILIRNHGPASKL